MSWILVFVGGGLGSIARYGIGKLTDRLYAGTFPMGTFVSNILACVILAILVYLFKEKYGQLEWMKPLLVIGFCGGFSTFSSFSNENVQLMTNGQWGLAVFNILLSLVIGIGSILYLRSI